jgi:hypothetical protein
LRNAATVLVISEASSESSGCEAATAADGISSRAQRTAAAIGGVYGTGTLLRMEAPF